MSFAAPETEKKQKTVAEEEEQPFTSFEAFGELIGDQDPSMEYFIPPLEYASIGHPLPSRFRIFESCKWKLCWDLAPELTVSAMRFKSDGKDYFRVKVNDENTGNVYSKDEFEKALSTDMLVRPLKTYRRAQWFKEQVPYPQFLEWSKCWGCARIGKALTVYVYDEGEVLLSYRIGGVNSMGTYLEGKESIQMAASAVKGYIEECLIKK